MLVMSSYIDVLLSLAKEKKKNLCFVFFIFQLFAEEVILFTTQHQQFGV